MASPLDMTICRRCGEPMAAVVSGGAHPRYLCVRCGDWSAPSLPAVRPAAAGDLTELLAGPAEQVGLNLDVVVRRGAISSGRQAFNQPAARNANQLPLHETPLPQLHCG